MRGPQTALSHDDEGYRKTRGKYFKGIKELSSKKVIRPHDQLKFLYTNKMAAWETDTRTRKPPC